MTCDELEILLNAYSKLPEWLGEAEPSIHSQSLFGDYPINVAATRGQMDEVSLLVSCGADVNQKGEHGYSPLHNAVEQGHADIVTFLLDHGAQEDAPNDDGVSPKELATLLGSKDIKRILDDWRPGE